MSCYSQQLLAALSDADDFTAADVMLAGRQGSPLRWLSAARLSVCHDLLSPIDSHVHALASQ